MGKYAEALGIWTLTLGEGDTAIKFDLHPKSGDNYKLSGILDRNKDNTANMDKEIGGYLVELITREYPHEGEDLEELKSLVEMNITSATEQLLIAFKRVSKDDLETAKSVAMAKLKKKVESD